MAMAYPPLKVNPLPQSNPRPEAKCKLGGIGRAYVQQYYAVLHQAPDLLYKFYNDSSSFIHGGTEKRGEEKLPVLGEQAIRQKIKEQNFQDTHFIIHQVDSLPALGEGIVVQVSGALSNKGQKAYRRFMQTVVLEKLGHKRYFPLNDIFRYEDEVFPNKVKVEVEDEFADAEDRGKEIVFGAGAPAEASLQDT